MCRFWLGGLGWALGVCTSNSSQVTPVLPGRTPRGARLRQPQRWGLLRATETTSTLPQSFSGGDRVAQGRPADSALHQRPSHVTPLSRQVWGGGHTSPMAGGTRAQRGSFSCPRAHSQSVGGRRLVPSQCLHARKLQNDRIPWERTLHARAGLGASCLLCGTRPWQLMLS